MQNDRQPLLRGQDGWQLEGNVHRPYGCVWKNLFRFLVANGFLFGLAIAVAAAAIYPDVATSKRLHIPTVQNVLIAVLLFCMGLKLPLSELRDGLLSWRVHLITQLCLLVVFPLTVWAIVSLPWIVEWLSAEAARAVILVQTLPTTTSTCVVFTAAAKGNASAALANACLSNLLGVFTAPALIYFLITHGTDSPAFEGNILKTLGFIVFVPFALGQFARQVLLKSSNVDVPDLSLCYTFILLLVTYVVFAQVFVEEAQGQTLSGRLFLELVIFLLGIHFLCWLLVFLLTSGWGRMEMSPYDRVATLFCSTQRSVATGIPMVAILFPASEVGVYSLTIIVYHAILTISAGIALEPLARWVASAPQEIVLAWNLPTEDPPSGGQGLPPPTVAVAAAREDIESRLSVNAVAGVSGMAERWSERRRSIATSIKSGNGTHDSKEELCRDLYDEARGTRILRAVSDGHPGYNVNRSVVRLEGDSIEGDLQKSHSAPDG